MLVRSHATRSGNLLFLACSGFRELQSGTHFLPQTIPLDDEVRIQFLICVFWTNLLNR